jgi:sialidase-1
LKPVIAALLVCLLSSVASAQAPAPKVERTPVVTGQGYFPVACRLQDGRIAVVMRGGAPHIGIKGRLDIVFSEDEGKTWSKPTVVVDSEMDDRNPAFGQAKDGTLVVGYWHCANYDANGKYTADLENGGKTRTKVTRSTDGGKTWSTPADIDVSDLGYGSPYGKIVTMPDGAMLMPVYGTGVRDNGANQPPKGDYSHLYRSTDNGQTWSRFSTIGKERFNETGVVRLDSGDLLAAMRTSKPQDVWLTRSTDGGKTWSEPKNLTPAMAHPADLVQLPDGRVVLVTGDRRKPFGVLAVVGTPDKLDFSTALPLVTSATNTDCGYPSSVVLKDGRVMTVYYAVGDKEHPEWQTHCAAVTYEVPKK